MIHYINCPHVGTTEGNTLPCTKIVLTDNIEDGVEQLILCPQCESIIVDRLLDKRLNTVLDEWAERTLFSVRGKSKETP